MATAGPRKKLGPPGPIGNTPDHQWSGAKLRFQKPDGTWGEYENLKGAKGKDGEQGERGYPGAPGRSGIGVPVGGTADQVLTKIDGTDYNTEWRDPTGGGGVATKAFKVVVIFDTDISTAPGDLVTITGANFVSTITDNSASTIPNGIFGVVLSKPTTTTAEVTFTGIVDVYSGLTVGLPVFADVNGTITQSAPASGMWQEIGKAVSTTGIFILIKTPVEQN